MEKQLLLDRLKSLRQKERKAKTYDFETYKRIVQTIYQLKVLTNNWDANDYKNNHSNIL
jgi:hypothetical protein